MKLTTPTLAAILVAALLTAVGLCPGQPASKPASRPAAPEKPPATAPTPTRAKARTEARSLMLTRPPVPISLPRTKGRKKPAVPDLPPDGSALSGRLCRLSKEPKTDWYVLVDVPPKGRPVKPARRILPCRLLEEMRALAKDDPAVRFRVWGEHTIYRNRSYVLPLSPTSAIRPKTDEAPDSAAKTVGEPATRAADGDAPADVDAVLRQLRQGRPDRPILTGPDGRSAEPEESGESVAPRPG